MDGGARIGHHVRRRAEELKGALSGSWIITVVGIGGTGRTRLVIEAAARLTPSFSDGIVECTDYVRNANTVSCRLMSIARRTDATLSAPGPAGTVRGRVLVVAEAGDGGGRVRFGVLGPLLVYDEAGAGRPIRVTQHRRLLTVLLLRANRAVSFAELADAMWDGDPPAGCRATLRNYVRLLRRQLGPELGGRLVTRAPGYLIELRGDELDLWQYTRLCERGREAARVEDWSEAYHALDAALALWRGPAFCDVALRSVQDVELPHLTEHRLEAIEWRVEASLRLGRHDEVVGELRRLVDQFPFRERLWERLMLALYRSGRQGDALAAYVRARTLLRDELGVDPGPPLQDMQRQILAAEVPPEVGAAKAVAVPKPAQLPPDVRGFTGRTRELAIMDGVEADAVADPRAVRILAVSGTAGVGKTALAVHWAHRAADRFPDGQLYVNLRGLECGDTAVPPVVAIGGLLESIGVPSDRIPTGVDARTALYRSILASRRTLILLDNARDADHVRPLLPGAPGSLVLVTSRDQLTGLVAADGAHPVMLDVLDHAQAVELLERRVGRARIEAEPAAATAIATACAGLPLALNVVAARAAVHVDFSLTALAVELGRAEAGLAAFAGGDTACDLCTLLESSYRTLSPPAARLFRMLAVQPGPDVTAAAAASLTGMPLATVRVLLAELARASLLREHQPGRFAGHELLRRYAAELSRLHDPPAERAAALHRILHYCAHTARAASALLGPRCDTVEPTPAPPGVAADRIPDRSRAMDWFMAQHGMLLAAVRKAAAIGAHDLTLQLAWALMTYLERCGHRADLAVTRRLAMNAARQQGHEEPATTPLDEPDRIVRTPSGGTPRRVPGDRARPCA